MNSCSHFNIAYRFSDDKFLGQHFRNKVYDKGPTLTIISANKGHVFGGYSPISWSEGTENNWRTTDESFLFTITNGKGRQPEKMPIDKNRTSTALFHSRISYAFGSGHDLSINLIDIKRSESALFSYILPNTSTTDANKYLAGRRDQWDVDDFEVFLIKGPISKNRYQNITTSLHYMARQQLISEGIIAAEEELQNRNDFQNLDENDANQAKYEGEELFQDELPEEQDSILDNSFLYKGLIKDEHLMTKQQVSN